jgi:tRNA dimethylallyltransferase
VFLLLGPTAVGKTDLAIDLALRLNAEIIGADAFQVYNGLHLLTAQPTPAQLARVPHHLIGVIPLSASFDAAQYLALAHSAIRDIQSRARIPLVVGGTGLYIRAITHGLSAMPSADPDLRRQLNALSLDQLRRRYAALDPHGIQLIDINNPRRLIRAIEVSLLASQPFSSLRSDWSPASTPSSPAPPAILLERDRDDLYSRIDSRVLHMFSSGVVDEVRSLPPLSPTAAQVIGLTEIQSLLRGEISTPACIAAIQQRTRRYAKRQLTFLKRQNILSKINLTNTPKSDLVEKIATCLSAATYSNHGIHGAAQPGQVPSP